MAMINKKTSLYKKSAIIVTVFIIVGAYIYCCLYPSKEKVRDSITDIEAYSWYEFQQDGNTLFAFDMDTFKLSACFADKWTFIPSCQGRLVGVGNSSLLRSKYSDDVSPRVVFQEKIDSVSKLYQDAKWKVDELNYYIHSHDVKDMGFGTIYRYAMQEIKKKESTKKLLDSLKGMKISDDMQLLHHVKYVARIVSDIDDKRKKTTLLPCHYVKALPQENCILFQLDSKELPEGARSLSMSQASSLARMNSISLKPKFDFSLRYDSLGIYKGDIANGNGIWEGKDGSYYEGEWMNGKRNGFGFAIAPKKPLRVGEWKNDRYHGERLVYTSERIYGIDISKYQHGKGKKKYPIDWKVLRISHLGSISKKTINGNVNFPIKFIYIKSTEGATMLNPYYKHDYRAAKAYGFKVGTYHFFSTLSPASLQVRQFLKHSFISKGDFPPVLDVEPLPSQIRKMGGIQVLFKRVRTWLRFVEKETGVKPILYVNQTFVNRYLNAAPDLKHNYLIWIARYGEYKPDLHLIFWQLCPDGYVKGIHGHVDINVFNGYKGAYEKFIKNEVVK